MALKFKPRYARRTRLGLGRPIAMVANNNKTLREQVREFYAKTLEKNAALICDAVAATLRSHFDDVEFDDDVVDLFILDPSEEELKMADAVFALSTLSFKYLGGDEEVTRYIEESYNDDLQMTLREKYSMALFDFETIRDGVIIPDDRENESNYDEDGNYQGPYHNGIHIHYINWI